MENKCETQKCEYEFDKELLTSFAFFLSSEIKQFYKNEKGQQYYENWIKKHKE